MGSATCQPGETPGTRGLESKSESDCITLNGYAKPLYNILNSWTFCLKSSLKGTASTLLC